MAKFKKRADGRYATSVTYCGKKYYFTAKTSAELDRKVQEFKIAKRSAHYNSDIRFKLWAEQWLVATTPNIAPTTLATYQGFLKNHILPYFADMPLCDIQAGDIRNFLASRKLASSSNSRLYVLLKSIFKLAVDDDILAKNPMAKVKPPKNQRKKPWCVLTEEQTHELISSIKQPEQQLLVKLAAASGLRRGEILGLRHQDIDVQRNTISVQQTVKAIDGKPVISQYLKTNTSRRTLTLPTEMIKLLEKQFLDVKLKMFCDKHWVDNDLLFPTLHGAPRHPNWLTSLIIQLGKDAGMPDGFSLHILRHTNATYLLQHGVNYKVVQQRLGHSSAAITLNVYSHVLAGQDEAAAETLASII